MIWSSIRRCSNTYNGMTLTEIEPSAVSAVRTIILYFYRALRVTCHVNFGGPRQTFGVLCPPVAMRSYNLVVPFWII